MSEETLKTKKPTQKHSTKSNSKKLTENKESSSKQRVEWEDYSIFNINNATASGKWQIVLGMYKVHIKEFETAEEAKIFIEDHHWEIVLNMIGAAIEHDKKMTETERKITKD